MRNYYDKPLKKQPSKLQQTLKDMLILFGVLSIPIGLGYLSLSLTETQISKYNEKQHHKANVAGELTASEKALVTQKEPTIIIERRQSYGESAKILESIEKQMRTNGYKLTSHSTYRNRGLLMHFEQTT